MNLQRQTMKTIGRFLTKGKQEIGLSPYDIEYRGPKKTEDILLRVIDYDGNNLQEVNVSEVKDVLPFVDTKTVTWFNVDGLHNSKVMQEIAKDFNLDTLAMAEVIKTDSRSRVIEFDNCILISIKMIKQEEEHGFFEVENLSLILAKNVLISFQEKKGDVFEPVRDRIRKQKVRIRNSGTDYLTFALLDIVIDNYLYALSVLGEGIEVLEGKLLRDSSQDVINEINAYKQELNFLRKNIKPAQEMVLVLSKIESELLSESTHIHFKELRENISQASEVSDSYRELLSDQLNIYHTTITSKLNDIMKFLTVFSVIFIPLTFIAGIYGTNFDVLPELHYENAYFIMWGVIITVATSMLIYFKRKKWL